MKKNIVFALLASAIFLAGLTEGPLECAKKVLLQQIRAVLEA